MVPDYSHVPILQEDALKEAQRDKLTITAIEIIQNQIFEGKISIKQGIAQLNIILGFSEEEAIKILSSNANTNTDTR